MTAGLSWVSYRGVRHALETGFTRRLENVAATVASQISPEDLADVHLFGEEGSGYLHLQVQLEELRATTGAENASLVDSARIVLYDVRRPELQHEPSPLGVVARPALAQALAGSTTVTGTYPAYGGEVRAGLAPVEDETHTVGVVAVEMEPEYYPVLSAFGRTLALTAALITLVVVVLSVIRVRLERRTIQLERQLSRSENLAAMGRLTATLAHEIKNPLAIIRGSAQRLGRLEPEAERMARFVVEEADRLSNTMGRYLQFARGDQAPAGEGDAVAPLVATLDLLEGELRSRSVALERVGAPWPAAPVRLDNESLKQVYLNLILNAVEAMEGGGRLTVGAHLRPGRVEVAFTDDGPGIPPEVLRKLGQPFTTTKARGSGLGLFLARRLVRSAGGDLHIESREGHGTACTVRLPRREG